MRTINKDRAGPALRFYLIKSPSKEAKGLKNEGLGGTRPSCTHDWAKFIPKAEEVPGFKAVGVGDLPWPPRSNATVQASLPCRVPQTVAPNLNVHAWGWRWEAVSSIKLNKIFSIIFKGNN